MFTKVLIANRGAVACRVIRTLRRMGVRSVAVYSEADADSLHVAQADEAVNIGAGPATESYLNVEKLLAAARQTGAEAIHPGYGFLSENADFAEACAQAGVVFIGPMPVQMRAFGLKHLARAHAQLHGVPLLPGSRLLAGIECARSEARRLGYPVMVKSTAGGGGLGLRLCPDQAALEEAFASVGRGVDATSHPGGLYLEKFIPDARHLEVQVFGDGRGHVVALGERDCSTQRRHQKVIEETPAPDLGEPLRRALHASAVRLVQGVGYQSAGTVEFLYDPTEERFYFLEVNTRLQVEHGITEEVTGVDLVAWMVQQAAGELDLSAWQGTPRGVSIEARIYAEDPHKNFQPSAGVLTEVRFPDDPGVRIETWVERGVTISSFYDPLLAKIIVRADTRDEAVARLASALAASRLSGIETNLDYLHQLVARGAFADAALHTRWLDDFVYTPATVDVLEPGTQSTIQDFPGRIGYWSVGVPPSGPMDDLAFRFANRLVGNPEPAAALELTLSGPTLRFNVSATVALTGARLEGELDGLPVPFWETIHVRAGAVLKLRGLTGSGCRAYLAVHGGFDVPDYLGSKSTFTLGNFGGHAGRALRVGDVLHLHRPADGAPRPPDRRVSATRIPRYRAHWPIAVLYGPQAAPDFLTPDFVTEFFRTEWTVHYNSNRVGIRLLGPKPAWARPDGGEAGLHPSNIHDNPYAVGTINLTGDMPVIIAKDGPSLGGFVCPATIVQAELWKVGQLRPGDTVRFVCTTVDAALAAERRLDDLLANVDTPAESGEADLDVYSRLTDTPAVPGDAVLRRLPATPCRPEVVYRQAGDRCLLLEYGPPCLDLDLRFRVHALKEWLRQHPLPGVGELTPGVRSLQIAFDGRLVPQSHLLEALVAAEDRLPPADSMEVRTRVLHLPLAFDAGSTRAAIEKYRQSVRSEAPWLPSNAEFIRRINGLDSVADVAQTIFRASYLVLGLGDVFLGAPCAVPVDPRHRLTTTKYNPARTWTAEGEVGIGGVYLCVYGMESPGGYQLVGRTVPVWNTYRRTAAFKAETPWLLRSFDQIRFFPMAEPELLAFRQAFLRGRATLTITEELFRAADYRDFLRRERNDIDAFRARQQAAFEAERERWQCERASPASVVAETAGPAAESATASGQTVLSPIAGSVWALIAQPGERVRAGQRLAVVEAMKMEIVVDSPVAGVVRDLAVAPGQLVAAGQPLLHLSVETAGSVWPTLDLPALADAYANGLTPSALVEQLFDRIEARGDDGVWITRTTRADAHAQALAVERRRRVGLVLPLYGVPFAVKDNIDIAGWPTTAACPDFTYTADATAPVVQRLLDAGAIVIGKTNLDQFATGLVGVRSPYGAPACVFDPRYIAGGSSAGSAVAVAAGLVAFALGTDTAGSGRIPAAFNNLVGWKPTRGLLSTRGVLPACRSLDCVSVLALTCEDAQAVGTVLTAFDADDPYSRLPPTRPPIWPEAFRFGVPRPDQLEFFGDTASATLFASAVQRLEALGGRRVEIDFTPFREAAELLYSGPWLAERLASIQTFLENHPDALHPVTARIIGGGARYSAVDTFRSFHRLEELRRVAEVEWRRMDLLVLPTAGTHYTLAEVAAEPIQLNTNLGLYTNFVNLLDLCGVAVPAGFKPNGLPFGLSLIAPAFHDAAVMQVATRWQRANQTNARPKPAHASPPSP